MAAEDVLEGFRQAGVSTTGIVISYNGIPELAPADDDLPCSITYMDLTRDQPLELGGLLIIGYPVRTDILVKRFDDLPGEMAAVVPIAEAYLWTLLGDMTLGGVANIGADATLRHGVLTLHDRTYVGSSWLGMAYETIDAVAQLGP